MQEMQAKNLLSIHKLSTISHFKELAFYVTISVTLKEACKRAKIS